MTNSKRHRKVIAVRKFNLDELGIEPPPHIKELKNPRKHFVLESFKSDLGQIGNPFVELSNLVGNPIDSPEKNRQLTKYQCQVFLARSFVIQYFVVLDTHINLLLGDHQDKIKVQSELIEYYKEVDIALEKAIPKDKRTSHFERSYSRIKHFRTLRNQFAHYKHGSFILDAKHESFESFLKSLEGIQLDSEGGYHCYFNGKAGMYIPFTNDSANYINDLLKTGAEFFEYLLEIFYPG